MHSLRRLSVQTDASLQSIGWFTLFPFLPSLSHRRNILTYMWASKLRTWVAQATTAPFCYRIECDSRPNMPTRTEYMVIIMAPCTGTRKASAPPTNSQLPAQRQGYKIPSPSPSPSPPPPPPKRLNDICRHRERVLLLLLLLLP